MVRKHGWVKSSYRVPSDSSSRALKSYAVGDVPGSTSWVSVHLPVITNTLIHDGESLIGSPDRETQNLEFVSSESSHHHRFH